MYDRISCSTQEKPIAEWRNEYEYHLTQQTEISFQFFKAWYVRSPLLIMNADKEGHQILVNFNISFNVSIMLLVKLYYTKNIPGMHVQ